MNRSIVSVALAATIVALGMPMKSERAEAAGYVRLTTMAAAVDAIESSHAAIVAAYMLPTSSPIATALVAAARRNGANVVLVLEQHPYDPDGSIGRSDDAIRSEVLHAGGRALWSAVPLHAKVVLANSHVFLSDQNFSEGGLVVESDSADDYAGVVAAIEGRPRTTASFTLSKDDSLTAEAHMIDNSSGSLDVESESFNYGSVVYRAIVRRAQRDHVTLLVSATEYDKKPAEQRAINELPKNVTVYVGTANEKMAVAPDSNLAWCGSTNASTGGLGSRGGSDQLDWGTTLSDAGAVASLRDRFSSNLTFARNVRP